MTAVDENTQAAEPLTEPAPSEDETQSVYAWSNSEDDTEIIVRRTWKLPLAAVMLATAGLAAGITVWPHHSTLRNPAAPPQAAPHSSAPAAPTYVDPDAAFVQLYRQRGYHEVQGPEQTKELIALAHGVCVSRQQGEPTDQIVQEFVRDNSQNTPDHPAMLIGQARLLTNTAIDAMCPSSR